MKAEDLEVGKIYVMLEDGIDIDSGEVYIKKGHRVKVANIYLGAYMDIRVQDVEVDRRNDGYWITLSSKLAKLPTATDKYEQHRQLCEKIHKTYVAKNKDYGDSFTRTRREAKHPDEVIIIRLSDKFYRLKTLLEGAEQNVKSESIDDTLMDMANYCIMELMERAKK